MMNNMYTDVMEGQFIPDIEVRKQEDGTYKATSMGYEAVNRDQAEAVNRLTDKLRDGIAKGDIHPNM